MNKYNNKNYSKKYLWSKNFFIGMFFYIEFFFFFYFFFFYMCIIIYIIIIIFIYILLLLLLNYIILYIIIKISELMTFLGAHTHFLVIVISIYFSYSNFILIV